MESLPQNKRRKIGNEGTTTDKTEEDAEELKTPSEEHTQNVSSSESSSTPLRRSTRQRSVTQRPYDDYIHEETPKRVKKQTPKKKKEGKQKKEAAPKTEIETTDASKGETDDSKTPSTDTEPLKDIETETLISFTKFYKEKLPWGRHYDYTEELSKMLHSFGCVSVPNEETLHLVEVLASMFLNNLLEAIVQETLKKKKNTASLKQKIKLFEVATALSSEKKARLKDVVSFMRRSKKIKHTQMEMESSLYQEETDIFNFLEDIGREEEKVLVESFWGSLVVDNANQKGKQRKLERLKYRDEIAKQISAEEYLYFSECTKVSFTRPHKRSKFSEWMKLSTYPISFNTECMDVLGHLTYEFVEEIIRGCIKSITGSSEIFSVDIRPEELIAHVDKLLETSKTATPSHTTESTKQVDGKMETVTSTETPMEVQQQPTLQEQQVDK